MWQVIGQHKAVSLLQRSLGKRLLAHAYLFTGPSHVGKMTLAVNLAQAVNCHKDEPPCGECSSCQKIARQKHADVQFTGLLSTSEKTEYRTKTEIGIEQIRQIRRSASLPPFEGRYRVFIIDDAGLLSIEAANCLLKTLEEPFEKTLFVLIAEDLRALPDTVISRCQRLELTPLSVDEGEKELIDRWDIDRQKARLLARLCRGRIGWAISAAADDALLMRYYEERESILSIMNSGYEECFAYAARLARQFNQRRETVINILELWLELWRDLMLIKAAFTESIVNIDIEERMRKLAEGTDLYDIRYFIENIQQAIQNLRRNANPRLALEVLMMDIPLRKRERIGS